MRLSHVLAILSLAASLPLLCQVGPAASRPGLPQLSVGAGFSNYDPDFDHGRMYGGTLWIDYAADWVPSFLRGLGIELEARDLSIGGSPSQTILREDTAGLGPTYTWRRFRRVRPYAKAIWGLGNTDYLVSQTRRYNQSRTVTSFGGGLDLKILRRVWVRADYEYQYFPNFFITSINPPSGAPLDPQGFTLGALYHFGSEHTMH